VSQNGTAAAPNAEALAALLAPYADPDPAQCGRLLDVPAMVGRAALEYLPADVRESRLNGTGPASDAATPAAAVREVDLQRKYHRSALQLAKSVNLTSEKSTALRRHLGIDADVTYCHEFVFGSQRIVRYSDNAFTRMRDALTVVDLDVVWTAHRPGSRTDEGDCGQDGCRPLLEHAG